MSAPTPAITEGELLADPNDYEDEELQNDACDPIDCRPSNG